MATKKKVEETVEAVEEVEAAGPTPDEIAAAIVVLREAGIPVGGVSIKNEEYNTRERGQSTEEAYARAKAAGEKARAKGIDPGLKPKK